MKLKDFEINKKYIITSINDDNIKRRLLDIGIIEGTIIEKVLKGDPSAYYYRGTVMALRSEIGSKIEGVPYE